MQSHKYKLAPLSWSYGRDECWANVNHTEQDKLKCGRPRSEHLRLVRGEKEISE